MILLTIDRGVYLDNQTSKIIGKRDKSRAHAVSSVRGFVDALEGVEIDAQIGTSVDKSSSFLCFRTFEIPKENHLWVLGRDLIYLAMGLYQDSVALLYDKIDIIARQHIDVTFYAWLFWLWWPFIFVTVILPAIIIILLYVSASIVHIYKLRQDIPVNELLGPNVEFKVKARAAIALLWECHGWIWHGYEIVGFENLPADKRALVVYYHGCIPVDYYYLSARYSIKHKRTIWTIAAQFLFKTPGLKGLMDVVQATPGTIQQIVELLKDDEIVSVAPGGVREAQFSDEYYDLVWNGHLGFAKAACLGKAPIIPVFTQNVREAYRTAPFFRGVFRWIYEKTKLPLLPVYGGFPVKLRTIIGNPIPYDEKATPEEVAEKTAEAIRKLIHKHQRLPGSIVSAMLDRIR